jgi:type IV secretory pathway TrbF-like protein
MITKSQTPDVSLDEGTRKAKRHFEEIWSNAIVAKQRWQAIAFVLAAALLSSIWGLIHLGGKTNSMLYVVERDKANNVSYAGLVKPVDMEAGTWDLVKVQALKTFLTSWRTVTTDREAVNDNWDRAFLFVGEGSQAKTFLNGWFEQNDPLKRSERGELVSVRFKTFDVEGGHTYGLWWEETTSTLTGQIASRKTWHARVTYVLHIPSSERAREENSLGVLITELSANEVQS